jgi:multicomponent Na+:H+ antiporter subunit E
LQNIFIGSTLSLLLPHNHRLRGPLTEWLRAFGKILAAVPMAYIEADDFLSPQF